MRTDSLKKSAWGSLLLAHVAWGGYSLYSIWAEHREHKTAMAAMSDSTVINVRPTASDALLAEFLDFADQQIETDTFHSWTKSRRQFVDSHAMDKSITPDEMNALNRYVSDMGIEDERVLDQVERMLNTTAARIVIDSYKSGDRGITETTGKLGEMARQAAGSYVLPKDVANV